MCPDPQLLSALSDDEVPSPWKEAVNDHLRRCAACRARYEGYREVTRVLRSEEAPLPRAPSLELLQRAGHVRRLVRPVASALTLPWPAAAAILAVVFASGVAVSLIGRQPPELSVEAAVSRTGPIDVTVQIQDVKQLLEILNSQNRIGELTIQLPPSSRFDLGGEPVFLRSADLRRESAK